MLVGTDMVKCYKSQCFHIGISIKTDVGNIFRLSDKSVSCNLQGHVCCLNYLYILSMVQLCVARSIGYQVGSNLLSNQ